MLLLVLAAQLTAGVLLAFSARRALLLATAMLPAAPDPAPAAPPAELPRAEVLVPCHNEAASLPQLFPALEALDYPRDRMRVTLVDDASGDGSVALALAWAKGRPWARVLALPGNVGKAQALNLALAGHLNWKRKVEPHLHEGLVQGSLDQLWPSMGTTSVWPESAMPGLSVGPSVA